MVQFGFLFFLKTIIKKINISNNFLNKLVLFERFYFTILDFTLLCIEISPRLPKVFSVTHLPEGGGYHPYELEIDTPKV